MSDDCANDWGVTLCLVESASKRRGTGAIVTMREYNYESLLRSEIHDTFKGSFELMKVMPSGSDAQLWAIYQATGGYVNGLVTATGSYVSGNNGGLQNWSTSDYSTLNGPSNIMHPSAVSAPFVKTNTFPLPYYVPGCSLQRTELEAYEDLCLEKLHIRLLAARLCNYPHRTLLMELILAGNGASLSDRALIKLAALSKHHGFNIIVDDCMTGGRCGSMLLLQKKPQEFIDAVSYVTMGKWIGGGLVLGSKDVVKCLSENEENYGQCTSHNNRPLSNNLNCEGMVNSWKTVREKVFWAHKRREDVLKKLRISEDLCWGEGLMVFAPLRRSDSKGAIKNRFLAMLDFIPIDSFGWTKMHHKWSKDAVNRVIMDGVLAWVNYEPPAPVMCGFDDQAGESFVRLSKVFITNLLSGASHNGKESQEEVRKSDPLHVTKKDLGNYFPKNAGKDAIKTVIKKATEKKFLVHKRLFAKRVESFVYAPFILPPWQPQRNESCVASYLNDDENLLNKNS